MKRVVKDKRWRNPHCLTTQLSPFQLRNKAEGLRDKDMREGVAALPDRISVLGRNACTATLPLSTVTSAFVRLLRRERERAGGWRRIVRVISWLLLAQTVTEHKTLNYG